MTVQVISPQQVQALLQQGVKLIDVRSQEEYAREHIAQAQLMPLATLEPAALSDALRAPQGIIFCCQAGIRSKQAAEKVAAFSPECTIYTLEGGVNAWKKVGLALEQDKSQPFPIMRQVQMTTGSLILLGVVLGYGLHPAFFLLSGVIGAGLLMAGVTGWCGMALLLAKMPWNKR
ncbi:MAG: rhodanese family protein [Enterobacteriaceae bacterium]